jgi:hypothetical protein
MSLSIVLRRSLIDMVADLIRFGGEKTFLGSSAGVVLFFEPPRVNVGVKSVIVEGICLVGLIIVVQVD